VVEASERRAEEVWGSLAVEWEECLDNGMMSWSAVIACSPKRMLHGLSAGRSDMAALVMLQSPKYAGICFL
jgi:hypothetical protein